MRKLFIIFIAVLCCFLSGCESDEIDEINFVSVMGFDSDNKGGYDITLGFITPEGESIYTADLKTVNSKSVDITDKLLSSGKRKMYFGHLKSIVISQSVLKESNNLKDILSSASFNNDVSMDTVILCTSQKAADIVENITKSGDGLYIWDFYKNNKNNTYMSKKLTLADAIKMCDTQNGIFIPKISVSDEKIDIQKGILCQNYNFVGELNNDETQGLIYILGEGKGKSETILTENGQESFNIKSNDVKIEFFDNKHLNAVINVKIKAENISNYKSEYSKVLEEQIYKKINNALNKLKELNCDAAGISYNLMRTNNKLYNKFESENMFKNMIINLNVNVEIKI